MVLPEHPTWRMVVYTWMAMALGAVLMVMVLFGFRGQLREIEAGQRAGTERSFINRAWAGCIDVINDGEILLTTECFDPQVTAWYPPDICAKIGHPYQCGKNAVVVNPKE
jgi:hypothetical protein